MKLLTLNTHSWLEIHQLHKMRVLADFILSERIDVVALQEVNQNTVSAEITPPASFLSLEGPPVRSNNFGLVLVEMLEAAGASYTWSWLASHEGWEIYDEGVGILSRLPVTDVQAIETSRKTYSYSDVFRRCALALEVEYLPGKTLWCVSAHMNWWLMEGHFLFEHDFASLDTQVRTLADQKPIFLLGDFNNDAAIEGEGYSQVRSLGWHDAFLTSRYTEGEHTVHKNISGWEQATEKMRLDYVFSSLPLEFSSYRVVFPDQSEQAISDHSGVLVEFDPALLP